MKRRIAAGIVVVAAAAAAAIVVLGAVAGASTNRHIKTVRLLSLIRGSFEVSLGDAPSWMPLSGVPETLTLIAGAPAKASYGADNAYVGFTSRGRTCAATPATSKSTFYTLSDFFSTAHAATHAGVFAPNGGGVSSSHIDSISEVIVHQSSAARACIWVAKTTGVPAPARASKGSKRKRKKPKVVPSLATSIVVPLLNRTFAASVSNLSGATPGNGGYSLYAIDGGHAFRYTVATVQCNAKSSDATTIAADTPASESIAISTSPCPTDASTFRFSGADINRSITFPLTDALAATAVTLKVGGCELDPLTGASLSAAESYLTAVGCKLGQIEVTPYQKSLTRGNVAWASVEGGVAELAPTGTTVDLVVNGNP